MDGQLFERRCKTCGEVKPVSDFSLEPRVASGITARCKQCIPDAAREQRNADPVIMDKQRQANRTWRQKNIDKMQAARRSWSVRNPNYRKQNREAYNNREANRRALARNATGSFTLEEWDELCAKYNFVCLRCKKSGELTRDHVIPLSKGGGNDISNIQPLCGRCNSIKGTSIIDFR